MCFIMIELISSCINEYAYNMYKKLCLNFCLTVGPFWET
jgi:hypothetical protein